MERKDLAECYKCYSFKTRNIILKYLLSFFFLDLQFIMLFIALVLNLNCHLLQHFHFGFALSWWDNQFLVHLRDHGAQRVNRKGLNDDRVRLLLLFLLVCCEILRNGNWWSKARRSHSSHLKPHIGVSVILHEVSKGSRVVTDDSLMVGLIDQVLCYWLKVFDFRKHRSVLVIKFVCFLNLFK